MKKNLAIVFGALCFAFAPRAHPADAGAPATAPAAKIDWAHMTVAEKKKYMKTKVLPEMKKKFIAYNAKTYAKMSCATCHGDGARDGKFKMPNPKLPKLGRPTGYYQFVELEKKKPEAVKFMSTVVKPSMAALLGLPEWAPHYNLGFGCFHCHTKVDRK